MMVVAMIRMIVLVMVVRGDNNDNDDDKEGNEIRWTMKRWRERKKYHADIRLRVRKKHKEERRERK